MSQAAQIYLVVLCGGAIGSVFRYALSLWVDEKLGAAFPWGTLAVNSLGCLLIGWFYGATAPGGSIVVSPIVRAFVTIGICGGFTTMSSFSMQTWLLLMDGQMRWAVLNIVLTLLICLAFTWVGIIISRIK